MSAGKQSDAASAYGNGCQSMCSGFAAEPGQSGIGAESRSSPFSFGADAPDHSSHSHRFTFGNSQDAPSREHSVTEDSGAGEPSGTFRFAAGRTPPAATDATHVLDMYTGSGCDGNLQTSADSVPLDFSFGQAHGQQAPVF